MLGILGFVSFLMFDLLSLHERVLGKYGFLGLGLTLIGYASFHVIATEATFVVPSVIRWISLGLAIVFFLLLIYSVFIEVGLQTYDAEATHRLVTDGTYSLVRHPGVIWLFLTYVFAALYFTNYWLLVTAFVWTLVNTMYIVLQERLILRKLFHNYDTYIASTPMVIPSIRSMRRFMTLHNWRSK
jgi:protein-S-isoprenylcysteine O-methyltransferase Ste14